MDFELSEKAIDFRSQVKKFIENNLTSEIISNCLLYTSPSPRDATLSRMPSSA